MEPKLEDARLGSDWVKNGALPVATIGKQGKPTGKVTWLGSQTKGNQPLAGK